MLALIALLIWIILAFGHRNFWLSVPELPPATPKEFPDVDIIVAARDEAQTIRPVIASLLAQDYAGRFRVTLVDDGSTDGTTAAAGAAPHLSVIRGEAKPAAWSGKLWALNQGVAASSAPLVFFTDADVVHDARHLSSLVARLMQSHLQMVSEMVRLNCTSRAERALIPAFVYFFQMLYPFAKVNDPRCRLAAAAGGTILMRRQTLALIGGFDAIKDALIDDVALARAVKSVGPIYLGHSGLACSVRRYPSYADVWAMIARSAFTQLRYSALLLALTISALTLIWFVPLWALVLGHGFTRFLGAAAFALAAMTYLPTLARYGLSRAFALALPLIATFYMGATLASAWTYWFGAGATWKNRAYGAEN